MTAPTLHAPPAHVLLEAKASWSGKEGGVKNIDDDFDISPMIAFYRDGQHVASFLCPRVNKYDAIAAVTIGVSMLDADEVVVTMDTHISDQPLNPKTGKPWESGEMQTLCNDEGACETGVITDALATMRVGKDAPTVMLNRKYHVNHETREVHWVDPWDCLVEGDGAKTTGLMVESFKAAWSDRMPTFPAIELPEDMTEAEARIHRNVAGLRLLCCVVGGGALPTEGVDDPALLAIYKEYLTEEYVARDMGGMIGMLVPLMRARFGLDD